MRFKEPHVNTALGLTRIGNFVAGVGQAVPLATRKLCGASGDLGQITLAESSTTRKSTSVQSDTSGATGNYDPVMESVSKGTGGYNSVVEGIGTVVGGVVQGGCRHWPGVW